MSLKENYNFENLVNETERLVFEKLEIQLQQASSKEICKCQDCVLDMAALALNSLQPHYRVSLIGTVYAQTLSDGEYAEEVESAVVSAVKKIAENPSHD